MKKTSMEQYVSCKNYMPCKDGYCKVSVKFNVGDAMTSRFKEDLKQLLEDESFERKDALKEKLGKEIEERRCPDALSKYILGNIEEDKVDSMSLQTSRGDGKIIVQDLQSIPKVKEIPKIILILESPNRDEYKAMLCSKDRNCQCRDHVKPAPARGFTGRNIKHYLPRIFDCDEFKTYKIALINPIQYQCSLGDLKSGLKDEIFARLIKMPHYKKCFRERFAHVYNPGKDIVVNCCTG